MDFNKCNNCTRRSCKVDEHIDGSPSIGIRDLRIKIATCSGHEAPKRGFRLFELALEHPQSMHECLQQFPDTLLKSYMR